MGGVLECGGWEGTVGRKSAYRQVCRPGMDIRDISPPTPDPRIVYRQTLAGHGTIGQWWTLGGHIITHHPLSQGQTTGKSGWIDMETSLK